ncbi:protein of unknown function (plasmid) [Listeria monocytogenes R479a]|uniref:Uncharacterized protein n=1 Tax=Listeria monocytogenes TaxID=1639 RepID=A0A142ECA1_LISMN|nr:hypothetical protein pA144_0044 [Listeria monocytogenes]CDM15177.1 protein of unknown function [Listeria monocytogenes R479a]
MRTIPDGYHGSPLLTTGRNIKPERITSAIMRRRGGIPTYLIGHSVYSSLSWLNVN